jgi:DNA ligase-associated metallophosphoesterase
MTSAAPSPSADRDAPADAPLAVTCAGETLWLLPGHAVWWPAGRTLFIADVHIGKAAAYRAQGQPVPAGTTRQNLARIDALLAAHDAARLVVLGDFLHAPESRTASVMAALHGWRAQRPALDVVLVRGNHDDRAGDPPASLGIAVVDEPWRIGPFAACHHPQTVPGALVLAGHVHPATVLRGPALDRLRLPCFCADPGLLVLPAFGEFTGAWTVPRAPGRRLYAVGGGRVWRLPG